MNKSTLKASASVFAIALSVSGAWAQDAETVTVTGVRASLGSALELKKNATQMMDSIVSEDIGKLPDSTVVESLQHVTGISLIRNSVEVSQVLIRGLPDIQTLVNGRAMFTSTGRALSLPDIPSEMLASVDVHKASASTDIQGGLSGLLDIRLHRPFDFSGFRMAASVQEVYTSLAQHVDPQASFLISDRWQTDIGEIGLLVNMAYKTPHTTENEITYGGGGQSTILGPIAGAGNGPGTVCTMNPITNCPVRVFSAIPLGVGGLNVTNAAGVRPGYAAEAPNISFFQRNGSIERAALNVATQWKPSANLEVYLEGFYTRRRGKAPAFVDVHLRSNCADVALTTVYTGTNIIQSGASSCYNLTSIQDARQKEDTTQIATGATWQVTDNFMIKAELDGTVSNVFSTNYIPDTAYNLGTDGFTFVNNDGSGGGKVNVVGNPQLDPNNLVLDQLFDQRNKSRGSDWVGRIDGEYDFAHDDFIKNVQLGYRMGSRSAHASGPNNGFLNCTQAPNPASAINKYTLLTLASPVCAAFLAQGSGGTPANFTHVGGITLASLGAGAAQRSIGSFFDGKYGETGWVTFNPDWLVKNIEVVRKAYGYSGPQDDVPSNTFIVNESVKEGYFKSDYGFDVFGVPVDGNFGVRFVDTMLTEQAFLTNTNNNQISFTPTTARKETTDLLPSFNLRATLDDGLFVRFAASKTVTRPSFNQLNPSQNFSGAGQTLLGTSSSGNPNLSSEKSVNLDADAEYYWGNANHVSVAVFNRDVTGYIQTAACTSAVAGCVNGQIVVNGLTYNYSLPGNFQNASIRGVEAGYSQFLDFLPDFWSGFGWDVNATYLSGVFNNITKWHLNAAGIYEQGPYSFRVSYTWSSSYKISPSFTPGVQPTEAWAHPREQLDASFNYTWNDNLVFTLDATNIINSHFKSNGGKYTAQNALLYGNDIAQFDKTFSIGARYKW